MPTKIRALFLEMFAALQQFDLALSLTAAETMFGSILGFCESPAEKHCEEA
jgi:hypothetical protein